MTTECREVSDDERHVFAPWADPTVDHTPKEVAQCDEAIVEHHYLHDVSLVGEHLRGFFYQGRCLAVATWSAAAFHTEARDHFIGTAYKVSGWSHLGTAGWKRHADDFYEKHDAPEEIWVRELVKKACVLLPAPQLPPLGQSRTRGRGSLHGQGAGDPQLAGLMKLKRRVLESWRGLESVFAWLGPKL